LQVVGCVQTPWTHVSPVAHPLPQKPQFFGSLVVSEQPVAQHCWVPVQAGPPLQFGGGAWQVPPEQVSPGAQTLPQLPQLFGSMFTSVQPDEQH
jgi:hypothetical protein